MAYMTLARCGRHQLMVSHGLYSYGLYSYGLHDLGALWSAPAHDEDAIDFVPINIGHVCICV